jgi:hypothetical protein
MTTVSCGACGAKASGAHFAEKPVRQAWFQAHKPNCNRRTAQQTKGAEPRENAECRERSSAVSPRVVPKQKEITGANMSDAERNSRTGENVLRFEERWSRAQRHEEKQDAANKLAEARKEHARWLQVRDIQPSDFER